MRLKKALYFVVAALVLGVIGQVILERTVFSNESALAAIATAKSDQRVVSELGEIETARVRRRIQFANGPDWLKRERFVVYLEGSRRSGMATVERVLPTESHEGTAFTVTLVEPR